MKKPLFRYLSILAAILLVAVACTAEPEIVEKIVEVEKEVVVTQVVVEEVEVEKIVEVEKEVEVVKEVEVEVVK